MELYVLCYFFAAFFSVYLIVSVFHLFKSKGKGFVFWIDYILLLLTLIVLSIISRVFSIDSLQVLYQITAYGLLLFNSMKIFNYSIGVASLLKIAKQNKEIKENLANIQSFKYQNKLIHIFILVIVLIIQIGCYFLFEKTKIFLIHLSLFGLNILSVIIIKYFYSTLVEFQYFSRDLSQENTFNKAKSIEIALIEHIFIKTLFDTILNVLVLTYEISRFKDTEKPFLYLMSYIICFLTILSYGAYLYKIDIKNKITQSTICNFFFMRCLFSFNLSFIYRNTDLIYNAANYSKIEQKLDSSFNLQSPTIIINNSNDTFNDENDFLPCSFFIIFKMIYSYFKTNEKIYKRVEKTIEEEGIPFRNYNKKNKNQGFHSKNIIERISRISQMSNNPELKTVTNKTLDDLTNNMGDKRYKVEFEKHLMKNETIKLSYVEFKIESLVMNLFFELFPLYQISIQDVLKSLETSDNYELFKFFHEMKIKKKSFNQFYTKDLFLSFELYDRSYIPIDFLKQFASSYNTYLVDRLSNMSYTYLPLIVGVFNLTYLSFDKIIVIYRNPIAFSPSLKFNCWINYSYSDSCAIVRNSALENEIAVIDEIEIKNNISLGETDYNEIYDILKKDMEFIKLLNYEFRFYFNLFVLNNEKNTTALSSNIIESNNNKHIISIDLNNENDDDNIQLSNSKRLSEVIQESDLSSSSQLNQAKNAKKFYGSDVVSLLEKFYQNKVVENKYVFKLYFSELFKKKNVSSNLIRSHGQILQENKQYCKQ